MLESKSILAIIPVRGGSKEVPGKNLRLYQGKSLLEHTIHTAKKSKWIDRLVVSSEDNTLLEIARNSGADVPFIRPAELASDSTPGVLAIIHAVQQLPGYDYVIVLQVTSPLRETHDIDNCLQYCLKNKADACVSVVQSEASPHWMFHMNEASQLKPVLPESLYARRQELPITYVLNGAMYVAETHWFLKTQTFITDETKAYQMPKERSLDIDTELDFQLLNFYESVNKLRDEIL